MTEQLSLFPEGETQDTEFQLVEPKGEIKIADSKEIEQAEWCFQFFDNEPVVFAYAKSETESSNLVIELRPVVDDTLTFTQNGMSFKIFPREMSEESRQLREQQKYQNAGENQEAAQ
jgi:hypothetical protein